VAQPPGKLADPRFRKERATKASRARLDPDYHLRKLIESAPGPTPEQARKLAAWLCGGGPDAPAA
jgi:hypothetical protein